MRPKKTICLVGDSEWRGELAIILRTWGYKIVESDPHLTLLQVEQLFEHKYVVYVPDRRDLRAAIKLALVAKRGPKPRAKHC